jgi:hypothetical protein
MERLGARARAALRENVPRTTQPVQNVVSEGISFSSSRAWERPNPMREAREACLGWGDCLGRE